MRQRLKKQLSKRHPSIKDKQLDSYVNNYVDAVIAELALQYAKATGDNLKAGEISFGAEAVAINCKQAMVDGKRIRVFALMQEAPETSLVIQTYKGNNYSQRVSKVTLNQKYRKAVFRELTEKHELISERYLDELQAKSNYQICIDVAALDSYIKATRAELNKAVDWKHIEKLYRNLSAATQVRLRAVQHEDGSMWTHEYWDRIDSGRAHGHGLSLQRVAKEVRHAALGRCWKIDIKASSYAILTSLALSINPKLLVGELTDYIKYRSPVRTRIAEKVGISEDWMKQIFTAMGFGAELQNNPFKSIRRMLGADKYAVLTSTQEFMQISKALDDVRKTILDSEEYSGDVFTIGDYTYNATDPNTGKKRSVKQKLAWIYQACERKALNVLIANIPDEYDVLLPVHDCLYVRRNLPSDLVLDLKYFLQKEYALLDFEKQLVVPIHAAEDHGAHERLIDEQIAAHKQRIADGERDAVGYQSPFSCTSDDEVTTTHSRFETDEEYERRRRQQFLLDIAQHESRLED